MTQEHSTLALPAPMSLVGKRVLVTGAASGIGQAIAVAAAQLGAALVLTDRDATAATEAKLSEIGATFASLRGDLGDEKFIESVLIAHGPYDGLAHAAGVFPMPSSRSENETFHFVMQVNLRATMLLALRCAEQMAAKGGGNIVLIGSLGGRNGGVMIDNMTLDYAAYATSKGGVHTMVKWLARRMVGHNVLVNAIAPGVIRTPMNDGMTLDRSLFPLGRMGDVSEIAWPTAFLLTRAAGYFSGAVIDVNGGSYVGS